MKKLLPFIGILAILKLILAFTLELGFDEAYYYTYVKKLEWSYFDHPLMVAVMGYISTLGLHFPSEFFLRLFPIIFGITNPILVYKITEKLANSKAAYMASFLYLCTIYGSIVSGFFLLPDAPLCFFGLIVIYFGVDFLKVQKKRSLYLMAFFLAFALSSKYQAIFLGIGFALCILKFHTQWLKKPELYYAFFITLLGFLPTLIWNQENNWDSFKFHSNRIGNAFLIERFPRELLGQFIYQNPIIFGVIIYALFQFKKVKTQISSEVSFYLLSISIPLIITTFVLAVFVETLPHWSGIAYVGLIILSGIILSNVRFNSQWMWAAYVFLIGGILFAYSEIQWGWMYNDLDTKQPIEMRGKGDPTMDIYGWKQLSKKFEEFLSKQKDDTKLILAQRWYPAGNFDYYIARPLNLDVIAVGGPSVTHQYSFKDNQFYLDKNNGKAYFIAQSPSRFRPEHQYGENFTMKPIDTLYITRRQDTVRAHFIYLMEQKE